MRQVIVDPRQTRTVRALELIEHVAVGATFGASLFRDAGMGRNTAKVYVARLVELGVITQMVGPRPGAEARFRRNEVDVHIRHDPSYGQRKAEEMRRAKARREGVLDDEWTSAKIAAVAPALCHVFGLTELPRGPWGEPRRVYQRD